MSRKKGRPAATPQPGPSAAARKALLETPPPPGNPYLTLGLIISLTLHGAILSLHFTFDDASRAMRDKALDVILVNAKSARKPAQAQALAQANLDGGGNTDEDYRAKTPLPPTQQQTPGAEVEQMQRRVQELEAQQQQILAQTKSQRRTATPQEGQEKTAPSPQASGADLTESARAMARLEAEINKSQEEYNKRPRRKSFGTRAEEYRFAQHIEDWRSKVQRVGTLNYPSAARGKIYGTLLMTVVLAADGSVHEVIINRSSGHKILDDAARRIVYMAAPYAPFPPEIKRDTDLLEITRTWRFVQGDQISTTE